MQKEFLKKVRQDWKTSFPDFNPVEISEIPKRGKNCNYMCDVGITKQGIIYFVSFQFSTIRIGEFTIDVSISNSKERSVLDRKGKSDLENLMIGSYRISSFLNTKDFWWALLDVDKVNRELLQKLGGKGARLTDGNTESRWVPVSFDACPDKIIDEALRDVNEKLKKHVLPRFH